MVLGTKIQDLDILHQVKVSGTIVRNSNVNLNLQRLFNLSIKMVV